MAYTIQPEKQLTSTCVSELASDVVSWV